MVHKQIKIFVAMVIALVISSFITKGLFLNQSPNLNVRFFSSLPIAIKNITTKLPQFLSIQSKPAVNPETENSQSINFFRLVPASPRNETRNKSIPIITNAISTQNNAQSSPNITYAQRLSTSKLGIFILPFSTPGAEKIIASGPKVVKTMLYEVDESVVNAIKNYKKHFPQAISSLRLNIDPPSNYDAYSSATDPIRDARDFTSTIIKPQLDSIKSSLESFDYVEIPSGSVTVIDWDTDENIKWMSGFWIEVTRLLLQDYHKKIVFGPLTGLSAEGTGEEMKNKLGDLAMGMVPTLRKIKEMGGIWSFPAFSTNYTTDAETESLYAFRYRHLYNRIQKDAPDLADFPLFLSEAGVGKHSRKDEASGWQNRGTKEQYEQWLQWFDQEIKKDPYVLAAALFQIGENNFESYNLEPISDWLSDYLKK
ncbi:hypothetical protein HY041_04380 [Candidatus Roizmanbacteria bacterium]|nr:hypothetical protein [Candidatus Roizmanbacteria bacterium]